MIQDNSKVRDDKTTEILITNEFLETMQEYPYSLDQYEYAEKGYSLDRQTKAWKNLIKAIPPRDWAAIILYTVCGSRTHMCRTMYDGNANKKIIVKKKIEELNKRIEEAFKRHKLDTLVKEYFDQFIKHSSYVAIDRNQSEPKFVFDKFIEELPDIDKAFLLMRVVSISKSQLSERVYNTENQRLIISKKSEELAIRIKNELKERGLIEKLIDLSRQFMDYGGTYL